MSFTRFQDARSIYTIILFLNTIKVHLEKLVFKNATYSASPNEILSINLMYRYLYVINRKTKIKVRKENR